MSCGRRPVSQTIILTSANGANGLSDMAGYAARVAVERCGSSRDTNNEDVIWRKTTESEPTLRSRKNLAEVLDLSAFLRS